MPKEKILQLMCSINMSKQCLPVLGTTSLESSCSLLYFLTLVILLPSILKSFSKYLLLGSTVMIILLPQNESYSGFLITGLTSLTNSFPCVLPSLPMCFSMTLSSPTVSFTIFLICSIPCDLPDITLYFFALFLFLFLRCCPSSESLSLAQSYRLSPLSSMPLSSTIHFLTSWLLLTTSLILSCSFKLSLLISVTSLCSIRSCLICGPALSTSVSMYILGCSLLLTFLIWKVISTLPFSFMNTLSLSSEQATMQAQNSSRFLKTFCTSLPLPVNWQGILAWQHLFLHWFHRTITISYGLRISLTSKLQMRPSNTRSFTMTVCPV